MIVPEKSKLTDMNLEFMCMAVNHTTTGQYVHCLTVNHNTCSPILLKPWGNLTIEISKNGPLDYFRPGALYNVEITEKTE